MTVSSSRQGVKANGSCLLEGRPTFSSVTRWGGTVAVNCVPPDGRSTRNRTLPARFADDRDAGPVRVVVPRGERRRALVRADSHGNPGGGAGGIEREIAVGNTWQRVRVGQAAEAEPKWRHVRLSSLGARTPNRRAAEIRANPATLRSSAGPILQAQGPAVLRQWRSEHQNGRRQR